MNTAYYHKHRWALNKLGRLAKLGFPGKFTVAYLENLKEQTKFCPILGLELTYDTNDSHTKNYATLDRVDPSGGYIIGNVRIISNEANRLKANNTVQTLESIYRYMTNDELCATGSYPDW